MSEKQQTVLVIDFGSQYAQLIARRVREQKVFARIVPCHVDFSEIEEINPDGIILSGGPANVYAEHAPKCDQRIFEMNIPILGICYGCQFMCEILGGNVHPADAREFGHADITVQGNNDLFRNLPIDMDVWMSHGDQIEHLPEGFHTIAKTNTCPHAAIANYDKKFYGVQFHPEVAHTPRGKEMLRNFLYNVVKARGDWEMSSFVEMAVNDIRKTVGDSQVILALSGGVDSSVVAVLLHKAIGSQLHCIFVDNGVLRKDEFNRVVDGYRRDYDLNLLPIDAKKLFLDKLAGVTDPERKRKIIGHTFIEVFEAESKKIAGAEFLAQGTLYPDVEYYGLKKHTIALMVCYGVIIKRYCI